MEYKKNDIVRICITDISDTGEGIGKADGYTLFVKDTVVGDEADVRITKAGKTYGFGRVENVVSHSPFRVTPPCPKAAPCGGCQLQQMAYKEQLRVKEAKVKDALVRIGGFPEEIVRGVTKPILGMEDPLHYRNKAQYPAGSDRDGNIIAGFYAAHSHRIIPAEDCLLGQSVHAEILRMTVQWMKDCGIRPYDETSGRGLVRHILIRTGRTSGEIMVCLVINGSRLPHAEELTTSLRTVPGMASVQISPNRERSNVIMGEKAITLWGKEYITDSIGDLTFEISAKSFYQVNPLQTKVQIGRAHV